MLYYLIIIFVFYGISQVYDTTPSKKVKKRKHQAVVHTDDTQRENINICEKPSQFYSVINTPYTKNSPVNNGL